MSGAGTAKKPARPFCWSCSRKLHGNFHRVAIVNDRKVVVHVSCAERDGLAVVEDAHLKTPKPSKEPKRTRRKCRTCLRPLFGHDKAACAPPQLSIPRSLENA